MPVEGKKKSLVAVSAPPADRGIDDQLVLLLAMAPALARLALATWWRTAEWAARTSSRAGTRVLRAATDGESPAELMEAATTELRAFLRELVDATEPLDRAAKPAANGTAAGGDARSALSLRARGAELLRRSADVEDDTDYHPAYDHIIDD